MLLANTNRESTPWAVSFISKRGPELDQDPELPGKHEHDGGLPAACHGAFLEPRPCRSSHAQPCKVVVGRSGTIDLTRRCLRRLATKDALPEERTLTKT